MVWGHEVLRVSLHISAQICSVLSRRMSVQISEDAEDAREPRDAGVLASGFQSQSPGPMTTISLYSPSKKATLVAAGVGGIFIFLTIFPRNGNVMPTDGAVQSRDRSLWQSTEEAADEHGILIIKHNERWIISKQETNSIYYAKAKKKSGNKAIAQKGGIPGFLHLSTWGCSVPGEQKGSSHPFSLSPVLGLHHHSPELQIKSLIPDFKARTHWQVTELPPSSP